MIETTHYHSGALMLALTLLAAIAVNLRRDLRRLVSGRNVVLIGILAWFLLEAVAPAPELRAYPSAVFSFSLLCVAVAASAFLAVYHMGSGCRGFDALGARFSRLDHQPTLWRAVALCALIGFAPIAYYSGLEIAELMRGVLGMRQTWGGLIGRGRYGGVRDALLMLEMFVIGAGPFAVILLLDRRTTVIQRLLCIAIAVWPLLRAYGSATRSSMLTALIPALAVVYFKSGPRVQRAILIAGLLLMPAVYTFMAAMVVSRGSGEFEWQAADKASYVGNEMFRELAFITSSVPERLPYQWGYSYYVQVVNPIPRFLWPGKPTLETGILLAEAKGMVDRNTGEVYLTNSPGLIGEMYLNFGLVGVAVLSGLGGWLVRGWDRIAAAHERSLPTMIFYCMGLATLFIMGRSFTMNMFYAMGFLAVGVWMMTSAVRPGQPQRRPAMLRRRALVRVESTR